MARGVARRKSGGTGFNIFPPVLQLNWNVFKRSNSYIASLLSEGILLKKKTLFQDGGQLLRKEFAPLGANSFL